MVDYRRIGGSFRDPSGFTYRFEGAVYRQVNVSYRDNYDQLMESGLYPDLTRRGLLVPHRELSEQPPVKETAYKVLLPSQIPFVSYPYEWCFSQLKDAALATLSIQKRALAHGMTLKDASAYNIQFLDGAPTLIDTLSFARYDEGAPWAAYRQFCQHFLAPLALMSFKDIRLSQLLRVHIDGIPLELAVSILPARAWLNLGVTMHLRLHARAQRRYAEHRGSHEPTKNKPLSKESLLNIIDNLRSTIQNLRWAHGQTAWADYYDGDSYIDEDFEEKRRLVREHLLQVNPGTVWDLGANTGEFSRIACELGAFTVSLDSDPGVVEANYRETKRRSEKDLHPLLIDLGNPSANIGWANQERQSLRERCKADCVMALALIHHLAIGNNVPLGHIAQYFASLSEWLIIEFVPKSDKQVQKLLASRIDIFADYTLAGFEAEFEPLFETVRSQKIRGSERVLYLMRRRE